MKKLFLLAALFVSAIAYSQCGVYLTVDDYLNGKLTDECDKYTLPSGRGADDRLVLHTKAGKKTYMFNKIWAYKDKLSVIRVLNGEQRLMVCKGAIYAFTEANLDPEPRIVLYKKQVTYHRIYDGLMYMGGTAADRQDFKVVKDFETLFELMDPALVPKVMARKEQLVAKGNEIILPEQLINYYNSLLPGYVPLYNTIIFEHSIYVITTDAQ